MNSGDPIRYAPDGGVERKITMPVRNIMSVSFGGADLTDIHVTSVARVPAFAPVGIAA